jgi:hypothetical protein
MKSSNLARYWGEGWGDFVIYDLLVTFKNFWKRRFRTLEIQNFPARGSMPPDPQAHLWIVTSPLTARPPPPQTFDPGYATAQNCILRARFFYRLEYFPEDFLYKFLLFGCTHLKVQRSTFNHSIINLLFVLSQKYCIIYLATIRLTELGYLSFFGGFFALNITFNNIHYLQIFSNNHSNNHNTKKTKTKELHEKSVRVFSWVRESVAMWEMLKSRIPNHSLHCTRSIVRNM